MSKAQVGDQLKEQAIDRVMQANDVWISRAIRAVKWLCENSTRGQFTTDAVWEVCERTKIGYPGERRAMGALMKLAQGQGWIRPTDEYKKSTRPECHSRPIKVWEVVR